MHDLLVTYPRPADEQAFLRHYREVHIPLCRRIPDLEELTWGLVSGDSDVFLVARLTFRDAATAQAALATGPGTAAVDDLANFAFDGSTILAVTREPAA